MKKFFRVILNIIRGLARIIAFFVSVFVIQLIKLVTYEPGTKGRVTIRKARRIRFLTNAKLRIFNFVPDCVLDFFGIKFYKEILNERFRNGVQLCYEQTDRRAV